MHTRIGPVILIVATLSVLLSSSVRAAEDFDKAMQEVGEAARAGNLDKALSLTRAARPLAKTPHQRFDLYVMEGGLCLRLRLNTEAREALLAALVVENVDPDRRFWAYMLIAMTYDDSDESAEIRATYAEALKEELSPPARCVALSSFASVCARTGDHAAALAAYSEMLRTEGAPPGGRIPAHTGTGDIHVEQEEYDLALGDYLRALSLPSATAFDSVSLCRGVAKALMGLGRHAEARDVLSTCADNENLWPVMRVNALSLVAESLREEGKAEEAEQSKRRALELDSDVHLEKRLLFKAQSDCEAASFMAIGRYHKDRGRWEAALAAFKAVLDRDGASTHYTCAAHLQIAELAETARDKLAAYEKVLRIEDASAEHVSQAVLAIGALHLEEGNRDKARQAFERIVKMEEAPAEDREKAQAHLDESCE